MTKKTNTISQKTSMKNKFSEKKTLKQKSSLEQNQTEKQEKTSDKSDSIEFNALLWNDLYQLYKSEVSRTDMELYTVINDLETMLKSIPSLVSVLILFKKIIPTIQNGDYGPFLLLCRAIKDVLKENDFNIMCIFVQIATTRFNELEAFAKNTMNSQKGNEGNALSINSTNKKKKEEAELLIPLFDIIIRERKDFNEAYFSLILPKLIENKKVLMKIINSLSNTGKKTKSGKIKERNDAIRQAKESFVRLKNIQVNQQNASGEDIIRLNKKEKDETSHFYDAVAKIDTLKKRIYDQYNRRRTTPMEKYTVVLPNIGFVPLQLINNIFWKKLDPWPIEKRLKECVFEYGLEEYDSESAINKIKSFKKKFKEYLKNRDKDANSSLS